MLALSPCFVSLEFVSVLVVNRGCILIFVACVQPGVHAWTKRTRNLSQVASTFQGGKNSATSGFAETGSYDRIFVVVFTPLRSVWGRRVRRLGWVVSGKSGAHRSFRCGRPWGVIAGNERKARPACRASVSQQQHDSTAPAETKGALAPSYAQTVTAGEAKM